MADNEAPKTRRLRVPQETLREKAVKAQEVAILPKKQSKLHFLALPFKALGWLSHLTPFKQIGHALRWFFSLRFMLFLGKILGFRYIRDSWRELKLVAWPTRKQSRQLTTAVVIFSVIFGGLIAVVDLGLNKLFKEVLLK